MDVLEKSSPGNFPVVELNNPRGGFPPDDALLDGDDARGSEVPLHFCFVEGLSLIRLAKTGKPETQRKGTQKNAEESGLAVHLEPPK